MNWDSVLNVFQGIQSMMLSTPQMAIGRIGLILLGFLLMYLGKKGTLEPLLMIPMGLGMSTVNAAVMLFDPLGMHGGLGTLFLEPVAGSALQSAAQAGADAAKVAANANAVTDLMTIMQIDFLQPIYTMMFSNGLIACLVFMGIGSLLDVGYVMKRPFSSMFIALCAELGTITVLPIATYFGLNFKEAASIAMVGGADGPMVLFTSLKLAPHLFVPIAVVAYLYLGLTYGGYPFLIKAMVPKKLRSIQMVEKKGKEITSGQKLVFAAVICVFLTFLFPVAGPLFFSLFIGVAVRESGIKAFQDLISNTVLYAATFFLGLMLGILCEAGTILSPSILPLLLLGILSLLLSGIGGLIGGYIMWFLTKGKFNPVIGIAGVSCVPSTAKVAQKVVQKDNPMAIILPQALGANISGVITTAIIAAVYVSMLAK